MINYEYQILRYIPDQVSGEFLNVGIVILEPQHQKFRYEFISKAKRISNTFHGITSKHILRSLRYLSDSFDQLGERQKKELPLDTIESVENLTNRYLRKDDSSLQFSEIRKGMDVDLDVAFEQLKERLLYKWFDHQERKTPTDEEIWREKYRKYFQEKGLFDVLQSYEVKTKTDKLHFDYALKNGKWNCFQPINFNLKGEDYIKDKVYRWVGRLTELKTATDELEVIFLPEFPSDDSSVNDFITGHLEQDFDNVSSRMVTAEQAEHFLEELKKEISES